jgi:hypothetical protein
LADFSFTKKNDKYVAADRECRPAGAGLLAAARLTYQVSLYRRRSRDAPLP